MRVSTLPLIILCLFMGFTFWVMAGAEQSPNCGGNFSPRPIRPASLLGKYPASTQRVVKAGGCTPLARLPLSQGRPWYLS